MSRLRIKLESLILVCTVEWLSADSARQLRSAGALTDIGGLGGDSGIAAAENGHLHGPWILRACVNLSEDNDKVTHCTATRGLWHLSAMAPGTRHRVNCANARNPEPVRLSQSLLHTEPEHSAALSLWGAGAGYPAQGKVLQVL